jgi:hypothetical protein
MRELEARDQPYLFKLKLTKNVKRHIGRLFRENDWTDAGQGWEGRDSRLALTGWAEARRVVVVRRPIKGEMVIAGEDNGQQVLGFIEADRRSGKPITGYEGAVKISHRVELGLRPSQTACSWNLPTSKQPITCGTKQFADAGG